MASFVGWNDRVADGGCDMGSDYVRHVGVPMNEKGLGEIEERWAKARRAVALGHSKFDEVMADHRQAREDLIEQDLPRLLRIVRAYREKLLKVKELVMALRGPVSPEDQGTARDILAEVVDVE